MPWPDVVGHAPVVTRLERGLRDGTLAHATLLTGPDGVGKTTIAEALAATVLSAASWPGGLSAHPDHWLEDSPAERIGIERVRAGGGTPEEGPSLQDFLTLRAYAGGRRVAVLARADRLTEPAANCVLKTLEEPPEGTHIVLCAAHPERMPATILSRCQAMACAPVPSGEIRRWLEQRHGVAPGQAALAAALAGGRPGRALVLATAPGALRADVAAVDAFIAAAGTGRLGAMRAAGELAPPNSAEGRERALAQVAAWTGFVRDVACVHAGAPDLAVWTAYGEAARTWAAALTEERVVGILGRCVDTADQLAQYASPRLAYEVLFLDVFAQSPAPPHTQPAVHDPALLGPAGDAAPSKATTTRPRARRRT